MKLSARLGLPLQRCSQGMTWSVTQRYTETVMTKMQLLRLHTRTYTHTYIYIYAYIYIYTYIYIYIHIYMYIYVYIIYIHMYDITYNVIQCHDYSVQHAWHDAIVHTSTAVFGYRTGWCGLFLTRTISQNGWKASRGQHLFEAKKKHASWNLERWWATLACVHIPPGMSWGHTFFKIWL